MLYIWFEKPDWLNKKKKKQTWFWFIADNNLQVFGLDSFLGFIIKQCSFVSWQAVRSLLKMIS